MNKRQKDRRPLIDTNVFVEREVPEATIERMALSSVVLYELIAANIDNTTMAYYLSLARTFAESKLLLTPTPNDWLECSRLIRNMLRGAKSKTAGYVKKITSAQQQQNDALIARSAVLNDCFVVTNNVRDFEKFQPYMSGLIIAPVDYYFDD